MPYDFQLDIFNKTIKPILLYGSEVWGFGNYEIIERVHLRFIKYIFKLKKSTPSHLGIFPITTEIQTRILPFWSKLTENTASHKLSPTVYNIVYNMHENRHLKWQDNR